jgi:cytochrome c-type biogenesis protein CcmH/NrfG
MSISSRVLPVLIVSCLATGVAAAAGAPPGPGAAPFRSAAAESADDSVDGLIARGRAALDAGRAAEAQKIFEEAAAKDADSLRTRVWVLRSWLSQGRINDTLNATDALAKAGAKGPELDYLYGTAFALIARMHIEQQNGTGLVEMNLRDAIASLEKATQADPERFSDAFALLAEAAWRAQEFEVARTAAETACARAPESAQAAFLLGRIALAQFSALAADASQKALADRHWEAARAALQRTIELLVASQDPAQLATLAKAHVDLGHALVWKGRNEDAAREYGLALAADPSVVNFQQILGALGKERFRAALEAGEKGFKEAAAESKADARLLWWLGWSRYDQKEYASADEAFSAAVKKEPSYVNSWYYIALSRYHQKDFDGAIAALRRNQDENAPDLVASIASDADLNLRILDYLVGYCAERQRNLEAALLSELQAAVVPTNADYWNNAGLFYRDAGARLRSSENPEDRALAQRYFEKAYAAYTSALEISPDNPALLNDTAVMLHYYLDRDLDKAKALYAKAAERAAAELERADLAPDLRELYTTALRDSKNNLAKLERGDKREN